jgi:folate-binding protein YgfZ
MLLLPTKRLLRFWQEGLRGKAYRLIAGIEHEHKLVKVLEEAGIFQLHPEIYDVLRVEAGLPAEGHELTDAYIPLEVNLDEAISSNKGCYTGQEIIARQVTYDKVARHMVGLRLEQAVNPGAAIYAEDKRIGEVT